MNNKTTIIAEIGVNHNGDEKLIYELIEKAIKSGADIVKFQSFTAKTLACKTIANAEYQIKNLNDNNQYCMLKKLQLKKSWYEKIIKFCNKKKIDFLFSPFSEEDIIFLSSLGIKRFKIPSGEIINIPYLRLISSKAKEIIMSTGMANYEEIDKALKILKNIGVSKKKISLLHCTSEYPAPFNQINLNVLKSFKEKYDVDIGYSDHSDGIEVAIAAVALGAKIIEKHFTLDKSFDGPDHNASLNPREFSIMVKSIRNIENALGHHEKVPTIAEIKNAPFVRKKIVAKKEIFIGDVFNEDNITSKRSSIGTSVFFWDQVIGKKSKKNYKIDEGIVIES
jgi:N,N'-diacetyllegionaminate synthase